MDGLPFRYVTYDEYGALTGCFFQVPPALHVECLIEVDESYVWTWTMYRANADRSGVELIQAEPAPDPGEPIAQQ